MATIRKEPLTNGEVYHIFNKSIAEYVIFNKTVEYERFLNVMLFSNHEDLHYGFAKHLEKKDKDEIPRGNLVDIIAFCLMPTHYHLILRQKVDNGISLFVSRIANSYAKYFNASHKRHGPLWQGRFKNRLLKGDAELLHLTRYIHLNPVTAYLVDKPEDWEYSSYLCYLRERECKGVDFDFMDINPGKYREFVNDNISYQRELAKIKSLIIE